MCARHREVMLSLLVRLAIFFSHVRQQWNSQGAHVDAGSRTELEIVKRERVSVKGFMPECVC